MITLTLRCKVHPRYRALRPPKPGLDCQGCNCSGLWFVRQAAQQVLRGMKTTDVAIPHGLVKNVT